MEKGIGLHIIESYPASNLVRDRNGAPKQGFYGDCWRAMVTSQAAKSAIRNSDVFRSALDGLLCSERSRYLTQVVVDALRAMGVDEEKVRKIAIRVQDVGVEGKKSKSNLKEEDDLEEDDTLQDTNLEFKQRNKQPFFYSQEEIIGLAEDFLAAFDDPDTYKENGETVDWEKVKMSRIARKFRLSLPSSADIRLFGRYSTSRYFQDVASCVAAAHALSTHAIRHWNDEWTAVDTYVPNHGAAGMGTTQLNASVFYYYYHLDWMQLLANFEGDTETALRVAKAFINGAIYMTPKSYRNATGHDTLPGFVMAQIIENDRPRSYHTAFEVALRPFTLDAVQSLAQTIRTLDDCYPMPGIADNRFWFSPLSGLEFDLAGKRVVSSEALLKQLEANLLKGQS